MGGERVGDYRADSDSTLTNAAPDIIYQTAVKEVHTHDSRNRMASHVGGHLIAKHEAEQPLREIHEPRQLRKFVEKRPECAKPRAGAPVPLLYQPPVKNSAAPKRIVEMCLHRFVTLERLFQRPCGGDMASAGAEIE